MATLSAEEMLNQWRACVGRRQTLETVFEELAQYYRPQRLGFTSEQTPGSSRQSLIYDGEQIDAVSQLSNSMESMLIPSSERWVEIGTEARIEARDDDAALWLADATNTLIDQMYEPRAGLQMQGPQVFGDLVTFGAGPMRVSERSDLKGFLFSSMHLRNVHWWPDEAGLPQIVYCKIELRSDQVEQRMKSWTSSISPATKRAIDSDKNRTLRIPFLEIVAPRYDRQLGSFHSRDMPWGVYLLEINEANLVNESGEQDMPWVIPTWEVLDGGSDIWSPGRRGLPDVRQLQQMARTVLRAAQRVVEPPLMTVGGAFSKLNLSPNMINYFDPSIVAKLQGIQKLVQPLELAGNFQIGLEMQQEQRKKINEIFLKSVLRLPDKSGMTATEVMRLNQDLVRLTDSPFGRLDTGFIQPMVERCFNILLRKSILAGFDKRKGSAFLPVPPSLRGATTKYKFLNPITRARKIAETAQLSTFLESMIPVAQVRPEVLDNIDLDLIFRDYTATTLAPKYLVPADQVQAKRAQREQQAQQQQQAEAAKNLGQAAGGAAPMMKLLQGPQNDQQPAAEAA